MGLKLRRRIGLAPACLTAVFLWTAPSVAFQIRSAPPEPAAASVTDLRRTLRVAVDDNYPPYIFRNERGEITGYLPDLWRLWEHKTGVDVTLFATDWAKAQAIMDSRAAEVIDTMFRTPAREGKYDFTPPYADIPVSIYAHADVRNIDKLNDLIGFSVGVKSGDACAEHLKAAGVATQVAFDSYQHLVNAAVDGRVKIFCLDNPPANYLLFKAGALSDFRQAFHLYSGAFHRAVRKGDEETLALVKRGFAAIPEAEEAALRDKWLGTPAKSPYGRYLLYAALGLAALGGGVVIIIALLRLEVARRTRELNAEKIRLRTLIDALPDLVWLKDADGYYLACNAEFGRFFGATEQEIVGKTDHDFVPKQLADFFRENDRRAMARGGPSVNEEEVTYAGDGRRALLETIKTPMNDGAGGLVGVLGIGRDITERRRQDRRLALAAQVFDSTADGVMVAGADQRIIAVNRAFTAITGYDEHEAVGMRPRDLPASGRHGEDFFDEITRAVTESGSWRGEIWSRRKNGEIFPEWRTVSAVKDEHGEFLNYVSVFSDITAVKQAQEALDFMAYHDTLTGLPNRAYFVRRLEGALSAAGDRRIAVLFVDLDGFKHVNDSLGHQVGDRLLRAVAEAAQACVGEAGIIARLGGDEFVVILERGPDAVADVAKTAAALNHIFDQPFSVSGRDLYVTASIGVAQAPDDGTDADTLLKHADLAMYAAKSQGRNTFRFYEPAMGEKATQRQQLENALRGALRRNELFLHYQPQFRLSDGALTGVEALARWRSPEFGMVPPDRFIPLAEENGAILEIGAWVLREACRQLAEWRAAGIDLPTMAINLSAQQIKHGRAPDLVIAACRAARIDPSHIELEVTESMAMEQFSDDNALQGLRDCGVRLSIDDFGAGHSSLSRLRRLPVHKLKIDRSFIQDIGRDRDDEEIVATIVTLGRSLGLEVIAEGVETEVQAAFLRRVGCDMAQGYLFARPMTAEAFAERFRPAAAGD
jgi:diguanylate cyclase (GGDEF)-like protein/PAS domain S-box-containing protein